jgi:hypothetical protein
MTERSTPSTPGEDLRQLPAEARQYGDALVAPGGGYFAEGGGVKAGWSAKS